MTDHADTPTHEPLGGVPLTRTQRAGVGVRLAAHRAAASGLDEQVALAEVRLGYRLARSREDGQQ